MPISLKKNYSYNLLYEIVALLLPLITTPYIARVLSPSAIGNYSFTLSIVMYFNLLGTLGINTCGQMEISKSRDDKKELSLIFWEITFARIAYMFLSISLFIVFFCINGDLRWFYRILVINLVASALDFSWFLTGLERFKELSIRNSVIKILIAALIFLFIKKEEDILLYVFLLNAATLLGDFMIFPIIKRSICKVAFSEIRIFRYSKQAITYFIPTAATTIYSVLDKSMIGIFVGVPSENGFYEYAHRIQQLAVTVLTSIRIVTLPRLANLYKKCDYKAIETLFSKSLMAVMAISIPMFVGTVLISHAMINVFLGDGYERTALLLIMFAPLFIVQGLSNIIGFSFLTAAGKQSIFNIGVILGAVVNLILNLLLIPTLMSVGATIASVASELVILIFFIKKTNTALYFVEYKKEIFKYSFSAVVAALFVLILYYFELGDFLYLIVSCLVFATIYTFSLWRMKKNLYIETLLNLLKKIRI